MKIKRLAVALFFFTNGFQYANWVARLPEVEKLYNISHATLGTLLLCSAAGAITAMPFAGYLTVLFGSRRITIFTGATMASLLIMIPLLSNLWFIGALFFLFGVLSGSEDVAMNGQAVYVERIYKKPILSSFHGVWSIGTALGAGCGALMAKFEVALFNHFIVVSIFCLSVILWAAFNLISDEASKIELNTEGGATFRLPTKAIVPIGFIAFCGMTGEGSIADWSALYMHKEIGQSEAFSALTFGAFAVAMTTGRIFGDYFTAKYGKRNMLIFNSLAAIVGLSIALLTAIPIIVLIGFFIVGLSLATIVPIVYSTAGNTEGVAPSVGIAMATTIGYAGFFVGPPVIGYIADAFSLRIGLLFSLFLFVIMFILSNRYIKK